MKITMNCPDEKDQGFKVTKVAYSSESTFSATK